MTEATLSRPPLSAQQILCFYQNSTSHIQIIRLVNTVSEQLERIVFPGERLMFQASPSAELQIQTNAASSPGLADAIPCTLLQVNEQ